MLPARSLLVVLLLKCTFAKHPSAEESFRQCLISQPSSTLGYCFGVSSIGKLQSLDNDEEFDLVDGLTLTKNQQEYREAYNFAERDPADLRTLVDSLGHVFGQRNLQWDMGFLYPGLAMRVAPSVSTAGVLEFVLDPHREILNKHAIQEMGTGRLLARQFLLPFLLGFKFNVATLLPIMFGALALLAKKAVVISKIALIVSSAYALGTLLLSNSNKFTQQNYHTTAPAFNPGFGGHYNRFPEESPSYSDVVYRRMPENDSNKEELPNDELKLYGNLQTAYDRDDKAKGRNFAWTDDEKKKKAA